MKHGYLKLLPIWLFIMMCFMLTTAHALGTVDRLDSDEDTSHYTTLAEEYSVNTIQIDADTFAMCFTADDGAFWDMVIKTYDIDLSTDVITQVDEWIAVDDSGTGIFNPMIINMASDPNIICANWYRAFATPQQYYGSFYISDDGDIRKNAGDPTETWWWSASTTRKWTCQEMVPLYGNGYAYVVAFDDNVDDDALIAVYELDPNDGSMTRPDWDEWKSAGALDRGTLIASLGTSGNYISSCYDATGVLAQAYTIDPATCLITQVGSPVAIAAATTGNYYSRSLSISDDMYARIYCDSGQDAHVVTVDCSTLDAIVTADDLEIVAGTHRNPTLYEVNGYYIAGWNNSGVSFALYGLNIPSTGNLDADTIVAYGAQAGYGWENSPLGICYDDTNLKFTFSYTEDGGGDDWRADTWQLNVPPLVTTTNVIPASASTAYMAGTIDNVGSVAAGTRGFCWATTIDPTISGSKTVENGTFGTGAFTGIATGLSLDTRYYGRAYATNAAGTGYGVSMSFYTWPAYSNYMLLFEFDADHISGTPTYTIQDQGPNNHDGTYSLAPNPAGISGTIGSLEPADETDAGFLVDEDSGLIWDIPDEPRAFYEEEALEGIFGIPSDEAVDPIADLWGVTSAIIWAIVATVLIVIVGMGAVAGVHSPFFTAFMQGGLIFICYVVGIFTGWLAFSYPIAAMGVIVSRKFY